jgi:hypothetical protein
MRTRWYVVLLLTTSFAVAQTPAPAGQKPVAKPPQKPATSTPGAAAKKVAPEANAGTVPENAPVITLNGVCTDKNANAANCTTVVTRAQFEKILSVVTPSRSGSPAQLPPGVKRNMATQYAQLITVAADAEKEGVQNTPQAQELLKFARMQALAQAYTRELQQKLEPTPAEIQTFYNANASKLEEVTVDRIFIPKNPREEGKPSDEAAAKTKSEAIHARAVAGEPFDKLQKEAVEGSNFPVPPETRMVVQKGTLPPSQEAVLNFKPGEVSQVFTEPSGFYIYKLVSKRTIPLEQVKSEISQRLLQEKMQTAMEAVLKSAKPVLNEQYFGPASAETLPGGVQPQTAPPAPKSGAPEKPNPESKPK